MRYFKIKQDPYLPCSIKLRDFDMNGGHKTFLKEEAVQLNDTTVLYAVGKQDEVYSDFIENPVYMVSEIVKVVFNMYEDDLIFKKVAILNKEARTQESYYHVLTDHIEALSDRTQFYPDGREKKIILDNYKIGFHKVFQLKGVKSEQLIINLDVVESLLRRNVQGIIFEEIEVI